MSFLGDDPPNEVFQETRLDQRLDLLFEVLAFFGFMAVVAVEGTELVAVASARALWVEPLGL